jgi:hypothetical protein
MAMREAWAKTISMLSVDDRLRVGKKGAQAQRVEVVRDERGRN